VTAYVPGTLETDPKKIIMSLQQLAAGRSNATSSVTLTANTTTTTVTPINCAAGSAVFLFPTTANAATEWGNGTIYVSAVAKQSFTLTHANNAQIDRTFFYVCLG
jgi:hypothetical protein